MSDLNNIISAYGGSDTHGSSNDADAGRWAASPTGSVYATSRQSMITLPRAAKRKFKSYRLRGEYEKPWLKDPAMKKTRLNNWIVVFFVILGFVGAALICFFGVWKHKTGPLCLIFEDNFHKIDPDVWTRLVTVCNSVLTWTLGYDS